MPADATAPTARLDKAGNIGSIPFFRKRGARRAKLRARAKQELVARARFDALRIDRNVEEVFEAFDRTYERIGRDLVDVRGVDAGLASRVSEQLDATRERLYATARSKSLILRDLRRYGSRARTRAVKSAAQSARDDATLRQAEIERMLGDVDRLAGRLQEVMLLNSGSRADKAAGRELEGVMSDLDRTVAAYEQIDALENETERRVAQLRARQPQ